MASGKDPWQRIYQSRQTSPEFEHGPNSRHQDSVPEITVREEDGVFPRGRNHHYEVDRTSQYYQSVRCVEKSWRAVSMYQFMRTNQETDIKKDTLSNNMSTAETSLTTFRAKAPSLNAKQFVSSAKSSPPFPTATASPYIIEISSRKTSCSIPKTLT